jgi:hypothetical protein
MATGQRIRDLAGQRFERLLVLRFDSINHNSKVVWWCRCDCGTEKAILGAHMTRTTDPVVSCGCWRREMPKIRDSKPGRQTDGKRAPEYTAWCGAKDRCCRKGARSYPDYGGRGIVMCDEWRDSFDAFLADMGTKPGPEYSLERQDVNGPYAPWNCVWALPVEQGNNKRNNVLLTFQGRTMSVSQWARELGMKVLTLYQRIRRGMSIEDAFTAPLRQQGTLTPEERNRRYLARSAIRDRVRRGKMPHVSTLKCVFCGKQAEHYDHYAGYDRANRLTVRPVCERHHLWEHGSLLVEPKD